MCTDDISMDWDKKYNLNKYRRDGSWNWRVNLKSVLERYVTMRTEFM